VSFADLYAGKMVEALDRQHPRDLFDVRDLLTNEGMSDSLRCAFIVYLLSHNRPMAEILAPRLKSISDEFLRGFEGMTAEPVFLEDLIAARETLIRTIVGEMSEPHRRFLISFKRGEPDWSLLDVPGANDLPAVRWRQQNLDTIGKDAREKLAAQLEKVLFNDAATRLEEG
jgi:hypothetical protein